MRIDDTTNPSSPLATHTAAAKPSQKDEFLRLFVAQLQNQNPLDPQTGAEFVAQLAQFASVEQGAAANERLAAIQAEQASIASANLAGFVGKTATVLADSFQVTGAGTPPAISVDLEGAAKSVKVVIKDASGNEVRTIDLGAAAAGTRQVNWDGKDAQGVALAEGSYQVEVRAEAADGSAVTATPKLSGVIEAIEFESGAPMMRIGGLLVTPASVLAIS